jgi:hypothetical protein
VQCPVPAAVQCPVSIALLRDEQAAGRTPANLDRVQASRVIVMGGWQAVFEHIMVGNANDDDAFTDEIAQIWWAYRRPMG